MYPDQDVGFAASQKAVEKTRKHENAVKTIGHKFIPYVMEVYGHRDKCCFDLVRELCVAIPRHRQRAFIFDMTHAASTALATARAETLISATRGTITDFALTNRTTW